MQKPRLPPEALWTGGAVEVHISDVKEWEPFRQISYAGMACEKTIMGKGLAGYEEALEYLANRLGQA